MGSQPENKILKTRRARDAIFVHPGDIEYRREVSVSPRNPTGNIDTQIPAGTILDKRTDDGLFYPCKRDTEQSGTSSAKVVNVSDINQFVIGDWVELPESVSKGADRFRQITGIDKDNNQITLGGSSFSLSSGDVVRVIPSRPVDSVQSANGSGTSFDVSNGSQFSVGDTIDIGPATSRFVLLLPDGTYTGTVSVSMQILDEDGSALHDIEAEVDASSATEDTIMSELASQLDDQLSNYSGGNLGSASSSAGPPAALEVALADTDHDFTYTWSDNEISGSISVAAEDDSTSAEITNISGNTLTVDSGVTWTNGERVVGSPTGQWTIAEETLTIEGPWDQVPQNVLLATRKRGEVKRRLLKGLVAPAEGALSQHIEFSNIYA